MKRTLTSVFASTIIIILFSCNDATTTPKEQPAFNAVGNQDTVTPDRISTDTLPQLNATAIRDSIKKARMKSLKK